MMLYVLFLLLLQLVASSEHSHFALYPQIIRKAIKTQLGGYHKPEHPTPRLITYVQTFEGKEGKHVSLLPLLWHETKVTHVILAAVHLHDAPGVIRLNDHAFDSDEYSRTWQEVKALQNHGVKVMAMLGGAAGGTYKHLNGSEEEFYRYYNPLKELLLKHELDGIDLDIEESVPLAVPIRLLNALHRDMGAHFILTMSPIASALLSPTNKEQNISGFSYFDLDAFATIPGADTKLISWYNTQFYGNFPKGPPLYEEVIEAGWSPDRIVMGVLDSPDDGPPNGFLLMGDLRRSIKAYQQRWENFGGLAAWEYFDAGSGDGVVDKPWEWLVDVAKQLFPAQDGHSKKDEL